MYPLDNGQLVNLHVEEILREEEAQRLAWVARHAPAPEASDGRARWPRLLGPACRVLGTALIGLGRWLTQEPLTQESLASAAHR